MSDSQMEWELLLDAIERPRRGNNARFAADILQALGQYLRRRSLDRHSHLCLDIAQELDDAGSEGLSAIEKSLERLVEIMNKENDGRVATVHELLEWVDDRRIGGQAR